MTTNVRALIRKLTGQERRARYDALRLQLAQLERQEDRLVGWTGTQLVPGNGPIDVDAVLDVRDAMAEVMDALGWKSQARELCADTAMRRSWGK
jgi:hypothetical protein